MQQNVNSFEREIIRRIRLAGGSHVRVFAVGSPRNFQVVVNARFDGITYHKRFRRDIRDESHQFWLDAWDAIQWSENNFIVEVLQVKP